MYLKQGKVTVGKSNLHRRYQLTCRSAWGTVAVTGASFLAAATRSIPHRVAT